MSSILCKRKFEESGSLPHSIPDEQLGQNKRINLLAEGVFELYSNSQVSFNEPIPLVISDSIVGAISDHDLNALLNMEVIKADLLAWVNRGDGTYHVMDALLKNWTQKTPTLTVISEDYRRNPLCSTQEVVLCKSPPSCLRYFTHLERLKIISNSYQTLQLTIPIDLSHLQKLRELDIESIYMDEFPDSILHLSSLKTLRLAVDSWTTRFPKDFFEKISLLEGLESLTVEAGPAYLKISLPDRVIQIPNEFQRLRHLKKITFCNMNIGFPNIFKNFPELTSLSLDNCNVKKIPENLETMSQLKSLHLSTDEFNYTGLSKLCNLEELHLAHKTLFNEDGNQLFVPSELCQLTKLRRLIFTLHNSESMEIPEAIGNLTSLEDLCWQTQCQTIPASMSLLTKLQRLDLRYNNIGEIPASITILTNLSLLDVNGNNIEEIPFSLARLSRQCQIDAEDNSLSVRSIQTFQSEVQRVRSENPLLGPELIASIDEFEESDADLPGDLQTVFDRVLTVGQLNQDQRERLEGFFKKIQYTADYTSENYKQPLLIRLEKMLTEGLGNQTFRNNLFPIIEVATTSCSDRATIYLNLIEVQWILHCSGKNHTDKELASILIGLHRMELLDAIAEKSRQDFGLGDPIEVFLYYQIKLKDALNLPFSTMDLSHGVTVEGQLTPERLNAAKESILAETSTIDQKVLILGQRDLWKERIKGESEAL